MCTNIVTRVVGYKYRFPRIRVTQLFLKPENPGLDRSKTRVFRFGIFLNIIIIKNEKIRVTLCENAAGALYIVYLTQMTYFQSRNG